MLKSEKAPEKTGTSLGTPTQLEKIESFFRGKKRTRILPKKGASGRAAMLGRKSGDGGGAGKTRD